MHTVYECKLKIEHHRKMNSPVSSAKLIWGWIKAKEITLKDFEELLTYLVENP